MPLQQRAVLYRRLRLLAWVIGLVLSWGVCPLVNAQTTPSCRQNGSLTSAAVYTTLPNNNTNPPNNNLICNAWTLSWWSSGFTGVTIELQGSDDNVTWTTFTGSSTVLVGSNPQTSLSGTIKIQATSTNAYVRVNVTSVTGTGAVNFQVFGATGSISNLNPTGGGGGTPGTCGALGGALSGTCTSAVVVGFTAGSGTITGPGTSGTVSATPATNVIPQAGSGGTIAAGFVPTLNQNTTGNAATATALAALPTLCSTGSAPTGVLANGNSTGCAPYQSSITTGTVDQLLNGTLGLTTLVNCTANGGVVQYSTTSHTFSCHTLVSADIPNNAANTSGNAATATALAVLPTPCSSGNAPTGILANGNSTGCQSVSGGTANLQLSGNTQFEGMSYPAITITQTGTAGSTAYVYCIVGTDSASGTRSLCNATATGNATLSGSNYNVATVASWSSTAPFIAPSGACNVYRTVGGGTQGKIGAIASCSAGGNLHDTGLAGDATTPPSDTSGTQQITGAVSFNNNLLMSSGLSISQPSSTASGNSGLNECNQSSSSGPVLDWLLATNVGGVRHEVMCVDANGDLVFPRTIYTESAGAVGADVPLAYNPNQYGGQINQFITQGDNWGYFVANSSYGGFNTPFIQFYTGSSLGGKGAIGVFDVNDTPIKGFYMLPDSSGNMLLKPGTSSAIFKVLHSEAGTCALSSGSCTFTYNTAFNSAPTCTASPSTTGTFTPGAALKVNPGTSSVAISDTTSLDSATVHVTCLGL
jgi:hypothetical protein